VAPYRSPTQITRETPLDAKQLLVSLENVLDPLRLAAFVDISCRITASVVVESQNVLAELAQFRGERGIDPVSIDRVLTKRVAEQHGTRTRGPDGRSVIGPEKKTLRTTEKEGSHGVSVRRCSLPH